MHVYTASKSSEEVVWATPQDCLRRAPDFIDLRYPLASSTLYSGDQRFERLDRTILGVEDATWSHCVDQLRKNSGAPTSILMFLTFMGISEMKFAAANRSSQISVKNLNDRLIYHPQLRAWYPPSLCLWTSNTRTIGKASIAHYRDLEA